MSAGLAASHIVVRKSGVSFIHFVRYKFRVGVEVCHVRNTHFINRSVHVVCDGHIFVFTVGQISGVVHNIQIILRFIGVCLCVVDVYIGTAYADGALVFASE